MMAWLSKRMTIVALLVLSSSLATAAMAAGQNSPEVIGVQKTDREMNAAIAKGRATYPQFLARLAKPAPDEHGFYVKFDLVPGESDAEYIWATDLRREGGRMTGALANVPLAKGFVQGQRVTIDPAQVIDWSYFKRDVMIGNVTTRVLLSRMPSEEAAAIKAQYGW